MVLFLLHQQQHLKVEAELPTFKLTPFQQMKLYQKKIPATVLTVRQGDCWSDNSNETNQY
eukprot:m.6175 g.6175  ORF g.6175 m.6175 type:complete len:60 (-) comp4948_c0_seq1:74-253(-)